MKRVTWKDFEASCKNVREDFEDLCRIFFKFYYVKNKEANLNQRANNPGIETEPISVDGVRLGFQAKYFSGQIGYKDILDSAEKLLKYYSGSIDKVIIFCNKDISIESETYKQVDSILTTNNVAIELCCNKSILDPINTIEEYASIKALYFNSVSFSNEWFDAQLKKSLKELEPRYTPEFHVDTDEWHTYFGVLYRSECVEELLRKKIEGARKELKTIYGVSEFKNEVLAIIEDLTIPVRNEYEGIFNWYPLFGTVKQRINDAFAPISEKWFKIINGEDKCSYEERSQIQREYDYFLKLIDIIESFNLAQDKYFQHLNTNIMIVEGNAGSGKSHLLGYEAETHGNNSSFRSVLLLGHRFILHSTPQNQVMTELGLENITFNDFLEACEAKGELDGGITVVMIDALNECAEHQIWKNYFNDIITEVRKYRFVRLVCSIRSTYQQVFFNDTVLNEINCRRIPVVQIDGFSKNFAAAISAFFHHYGIPITTAAFFNTEFENPLFLRTYCEAYSGEDGIGSRGIFTLFKTYISKEERKIKDHLKITDELVYADIIFGIIGEYFYTHNVRSIPYIELVQSAQNKLISKDIIDAFLKSQIIVQYYIGSNLRVFINYDLFKDFTVAKYIIDSVDSIDGLKRLVQEKYLIADQYGHLRHHEFIGYFAALSVLAKERFNEEIIDFIKVLPETDKHGLYLYNDIVSEYITAYRLRANADIGAEDYFSFVGPYIKTKHCFKKHIENMLSLAGRKCSLNAYALTTWLMPMSIATRDAEWTLYINDHYNEGDQVYNTIDYFLKEDLHNLTTEDRLIYGQELSWFLTASNRPLRDKCSRALVGLLKNDLRSMEELLKIFIGVNDTYIISRLFGCVYGAVLLSTTENWKHEQVNTLSDFIYQNVFNKEIVYPDILLRDYALNIIEYFATKGYDLGFGIETCRPPYKSLGIPDIPVEVLNEEYAGFDEEWSGTYAIKASLLPNYEIDGFCNSMLYGDFGRYVFQSKLRNFKDADIAKVFKYAFDYIIKVLGYDNELFSENDRWIGYGRSRSGATERIGKKYEWIAMYHTLALVADQYPYEEIYSDIEFHTYEGSWLNSVRDFDPTLTITKNSRLMDIGLSMFRERYKDWQLSNKDWTDNCGEECSFKDLIKLKDSNNEYWIALHFAVTDESCADYERARQSIWRSSTACLISISERDVFIKKLKEKNFHGRWFEPVEVGSSNNVFSREYVWAPSYKSEYINTGFIAAEIEVGKRKVVKQIAVPAIGGQPVMDFFAQWYSGNSKIESTDIELEEYIDETEVEESIEEYIGSILPCYHLYSWDCGVDYAVEDSVSYLMPHKFLIDKLKLVQTHDGVWEKDGKVICADFSLIKNSNVDGLYIKQSALEELLKEGYALVWVGLGEKAFSSGLFDFSREHYRRSNLSSLIYEDEDGNLVEIRHSEIT